MQLITINSKTGTRVRYVSQLTPQFTGRVASIVGRRRGMLKLVFDNNETYEAWPENLERVRT